MRLVPNAMVVVATMILAVAVVAPVVAFQPPHHTTTRSTPTTTTIRKMADQDFTMDLYQKAMQQHVAQSSNLRDVSPDEEILTHAHFAPQQQQPPTPPAAVSSEGRPYLPPQQQQQPPYEVADHVHNRPTGRSDPAEQVDVAAKDYFMQQQHVTQAQASQAIWEQQLAFEQNRQSSRLAWEASLTRTKVGDASTVDPPPTTTATDTTSPPSFSSSEGSSNSEVAVEPEVPPHQPQQQLVDILQSIEEQKAHLQDLLALQQQQQQLHNNQTSIAPQSAAAFVRHQRQQQYQPYQPPSSAGQQQPYIPPPGVGSSHAMPGSVVPEPTMHHRTTTAVPATSGGVTTTPEATRMAQPKSSALPHHQETVAFGSQQRYQGPPPQAPQPPPPPPQQRTLPVPQVPPHPEIPPEDQENQEQVLQAVFGPQGEQQRSPGEEGDGSGSGDTVEATTALEGWSGNDAEPPPETAVTPPPPLPPRGSTPPLPNTVAQMNPNPYAHYNNNSPEVGEHPTALPDNPYAADHDLETNLLEQEEQLRREQAHLDQLRQERARVQQQHQQQQQEEAERARQEELELQQRMEQQRQQQIEQQRREQEERERQQQHNKWMAGPSSTPGAEVQDDVIIKIGSHDPDAIEEPGMQSLDYLMEQAMNKYRATGTAAGASEAASPEVPPKTEQQLHYERMMEQANQSKNADRQRPPIGFQPPDPAPPDQQQDQQQVPPVHPYHDHHHSHAPPAPAAMDAEFFYDDPNNSAVAEQQPTDLPPVIARQEDNPPGDSYDPQSHPDSEEQARQQERMRREKLKQEFQQQQQQQQQQRPPEPGVADTHHTPKTRVATPSRSSVDENVPEEERPVVSMGQVHRDGPVSVHPVGLSTDAAPTSNLSPEELEGATQELKAKFNAESARQTDWMNDMSRKYEGMDIPPLKPPLEESVPDDTPVASRQEESRPPIEYGEPAPAHPEDEAERGTSQNRATKKNNFVVGRATSSRSAPTRNTQVRHSNAVPPPVSPDTTRKHHQPEPTLTPKPQTRQKVQITGQEHKRGPVKTSFAEPPPNFSHLAKKKKSVQRKESVQIHQTAFTGYGGGTSDTNAAGMGGGYIESTGAVGGGVASSSMGFHKSHFKDQMDQAMKKYLEKQEAQAKKAQEGGE